MAEETTLIIEAGRTEKHYWLDLWRYRELFYFLAWRDILVRYKQTVIGIAWALIRPFLTMVVFTVVFGKLAKLPSEGVPYPILVFAAMLPWQGEATKEELPFDDYNLALTFAEKDLRDNWQEYRENFLKEVNKK